MSRWLQPRLERSALLTAVVYTGVGVLPLFLVSAQVLQIDRDIGFGVPELGLATGAFFGTAALAANPAGRLVSRLGPPSGLQLGTVITLASCVAAGTAWAWWVVPIAVAIGGAGNALIQVASNIAIFDGVNEARQGLAFGTKQASVPLASVAAGASLPIIGLAFGWRWVFVGAALLAILLARSAPRFEGHVERGVEERIGRPTRSMWWLGLAGITGAAAGNGISLFIVPSAVDVGIREAAAGAVLAACSLLVIAIRVGAGWLVDRRRSTGHVEMAVMAGAGAVGAFALMWAVSPSGYLVAMPIALLGAWGWPGIIFFTVVTTYREFPARASGLLLSSNLTGTVVGPFVVGALAGRGNYPAAWLFVSICAAISTVGFIVARRTTEPARLIR